MLTTGLRRRLRRPDRGGGRVGGGGEVSGPTAGASGWAKAAVAARSSGEATRLGGGSEEA